MRLIRRRTRAICRCSWWFVDGAPSSTYMNVVHTIAFCIILGRSHKRTTQNIILFGFKCRFHSVTYAPVYFFLNVFKTLAIPYVVTRYRNEVKKNKYNGIYGRRRKGMERQLEIRQHAHTGVRVLFVWGESWLNSERRDEICLLGFSFGGNCFWWETYVYFVSMNLGYWRPLNELQQ